MWTQRSTIGPGSVATQFAVMLVPFAFQLFNSERRVFKLNFTSSHGTTGVSFHMASKMQQNVQESVFLNKRTFFFLLPLLYVQPHCMCICLGVKIYTFICALFHAM